MIRKLKLQTILIVSLAVLLTSTVSSIGVLSYKTFSEAIVNQRADSRTEVLRQVSTRMSEVQRVMVTLSNLCFQTPYLGEILQNPQSPVDSAASEQLDLMCKVLGESSGFSLWYEFSMANGYTYSSDPGNQPLTYEEHAGELWFLDLDKTGGESTWTGQFTENGQFVISVARVVTDPETGEPTGLCMVRLPETVLAETYITTMLGDSASSIYMVDNKGRVVSHSNPYMLGFNYFNMTNFYRLFQNQNLEYTVIEKSNVSYLFSYYQNPETGWVVVEEIPLDEVLAPVQSMRVTVLAASLAILLVSVLLATVLASMTTKPLKRLCRQFEQVGTGASVKFHVSGWKEISTISDECNIMMERIENLLLDVKAREREKRKAEISMLQMQVHPHFLYNTLFSIRCLVEMHDYERAVPMMTSFISLLHGMLDTESEKVALDNELELLEQYVYIQKYRFGDKFTLYVDCPQELRKNRILRLLLQPLVENAILHGMKDLPRPGIIRLEVRQTGGDLVLRLMDNGWGMEEEFAEQLAKRPPTADHVGVGNVASRLSAHYGEGYGLNIHSAPGCGTSIVICVPLTEEEGDGKWLKS